MELEVSYEKNRERFPKYLEISVTKIQSIKNRLHRDGLYR